MLFQSTLALLFLLFSGGKKLVAVDVNVSPINFESGIDKQAECNQYKAVSGVY